MMSLKDSTTELDWVGSMILLFKSEKYSGKILIVLEGRTDIGLFKCLELHDSIHYDSPCKGKISVIDSVRKLRESGNDKVYGVCDADFDIILNRSYEDIVLTDFHDIEVMMISCGFIRNFFFEYTNPKSYEFLDENALISEIEKNIFDVCYYIGVLKWINAEHDFGFNFTNLNIESFVHFDGFRISFDKDIFISDVLKRYKKEVDYDYISMLYDEYDQKTVDVLHVCNGHDFTNVLSKLYKGEFTNDKNINQDKIERNLRLYYSAQHFEKTNMYNKIKNILKKYEGELRMVG
ncbi:DUF4435 domain-containing protein [Kosakonia sp. ML.JS2a]|uniref:DUF4435 domain-containing protein n=1 Tax=Kosakonia sp. ML.JS2a TaxID=2980557 RepID=UPI0021DA2841|nr:DUF4435 domain-containing protein [Kosakonia sp. ML.JS2a]UXY09682.1 DUF4435 domain-containing protein [Kosakonia sp. ML.JS2a]